VVLDAQLLKEVAVAGAGAEVDFCIVNDPFASLTRGFRIAREQLALLMNSPNHPQTDLGNGNGFRKARLDQASSK
jgi:hypothetical protein